MSYSNYSNIATAITCAVFNLAASWVDDYAHLTWDDPYAEAAAYEVWESKNGGAYTLVTETAAGVTEYDNYTWQNANMNFRVRAKIGAVYSGFNIPINLITPLVFKTDQSTLTRVLFADFGIQLGKTININWGDGTNANYTGANSNITHDYETEANPYFIKFSGDVNYLSTAEIVNQTWLYGDLSKWVLPTILSSAHWYGNGWSGDISSWVMPATMVRLHVANNNFSGNLTNWVLPTTLIDLHLEHNHFTGDITDWILGSEVAHFCIQDNDGFTGDLSGWTPPLDFTYGTGLLNFSSNLLTGDISGWGLATNMNAVSAIECTFTGDLSGWLIPANDATFTIDFTNNKSVTKMPRGVFKDTLVYRFAGNACNTAEIDSLLAYIDAYFVGGVVPLISCEYTLNGTGMGIPSAAGLASRTSIQGKYTAVGKTATININS